MARLFTKSAFKQALDCPASLYYYYDREHYANQKNEDDFLQALADSGHQAGDLAKVYYGVQPDADIETLDYAESERITKELFRRDEVNIAEAAFRWRDCFVRADIIEKKGNVVNLVEVKAKSWDPLADSFWAKRPKGAVEGKIRPYVYDMAFQKYVIQNALGPGYEVRAYLMMADKSVVSDAPAGVNQSFRVVTRNGRTAIERGAEAESLRGFAHVLTPFDVDAVCDSIIAGRTAEQSAYMGCAFADFVDEMSRRYISHERTWCNVSSACFKCPFFSNEKTPGMLDGKRECWTKVAGFREEDFSRPKVEDLWGAYVKRDRFIQEGKYFLDDLGPDDLGACAPADGGLNHVERKLLQIAMATGKPELLAPFRKNIHDGAYVDIPGLKAEMAKWKYPLHMIDFETTSVALPLYAGMRPYGQVAFQFSHHTIDRDGTIRHAGQFLNTEKHRFPNFEFVRELKRQLEGDGGTVFRYAAHENTILRAIREQLEESGEADRFVLMDFIDTLTRRREVVGKTEVTVAGERDMVDMLDLVKRYYYHPSMKGSNSIKVVLPAILNSSRALRDKYSEPIYGSLIPSLTRKPSEAVSWITVGPDGKVENPYKHLDEIASFLDVTPDELEAFDTRCQDDGDDDAGRKSIGNGGAALAAYTKLQFSDEAMTAALEKALLRYCELDTMSMVFIWEYFHMMACGK